MKTIRDKEDSIVVTLEELIENALNYMRNKGYSPGTIENYRMVWKRLARFAQDERFSDQLVRGFLISQGLPANATEHLQKLPRHRAHILSAVHLLSQYRKFGFVNSRLRRRPPDLPAKIIDVLDDYQRYCINFKRYSDRSVYDKRYDVVKFLLFLSKQMESPLAAIRPKHLSQYIRSKSHLKPPTLKRIVGSLRSFLIYLWHKGILEEDLSPHLPRIRIASNAHIPPVWKKEEIANLLSAVNRRSPKGKRDYAILIMAYRLGLRSIDIRRLCLKNIDWPKSEIRIVQSKTQHPLILPLTEECGAALIDYLQNGRPKSESRHVFLKSLAPFGPIKQHCTLFNMINFYRRKAGVTKPKNQNRGMHSLRHTFASRLLESNIPMETISELLGHVSVESTNIYTKVNTQALRTAALDPESFAVKEVDHA